jgi:hypothetical protein
VAKWALVNFSRRLQLKGISHVLLHVWRIGCISCSSHICQEFNRFWINITDGIAASLECRETRKSVSCIPGTTWMYTKRECRLNNLITKSFYLKMFFKTLFWHDYPAQEIFDVQNILGHFLKKKVILWWEEACFLLFHFWDFCYFGPFIFLSVLNYLRPNPSIYVTP